MNLCGTHSESSAASEDPPSAVPLAVVEVAWRDAYTDGSWHDLQRLRDGLAEGRQVALTLSVGFLVVQDEQQVVLVQSIGPQGSVAGLAVIPRGMVQRSRVLRPAGPQVVASEDDAG